MSLNQAIFEKSHQVAFLKAKATKNQDLDGEEPLNAI